MKVGAKLYPAFAESATIGGKFLPLPRIANADAADAGMLAAGFVLRLLLHEYGSTWKVAIMSPHSPMKDVTWTRVGIAVLSITTSYWGYALILVSGVSAPNPSTRLAVANLLNNVLTLSATMVIVIFIAAFWAFKRPPRFSPFDLLVLIAPISLWGICFLV